MSVPGSSSSSFLPSSTLSLSSSLPPTSTTAVNTPNRLPTTSQSLQMIGSSAFDLSTSTVNPAKEDTDDESMSPTARATVVSSDNSFPVAHANTVSSTFSASTTPGSTSPLIAYDPPPTFASSSSRSDHVSAVSAFSSPYSPAPFPTPTPAALDASWGPPFSSHHGHGWHGLSSDPMPEPTSRSGATTNPGSPSISPKEPLTTSQQIVSTPAPVTLQTSQSGSLLTLESTGPESLIPVPTTSNSISPNSSSASNSILPSILGPVLGVLVIVALGMTVFRCRARRRSQSMSNTPASDPDTLRERRDWTMMEETHQSNAGTLGRRITSYRGSSAYTPEHISTCILHAGESSHSSNVRLSDPFADSAEIVSSHTDMCPVSIHSFESVSRDMTFAMPMDTDTRSIGVFGSPSTSSLELHFVAPHSATDDSSTRSRYLSPSWHYDGQSPTSSPGEMEHWNEERQGESSPPASPKVFSLGTESARLRLHELLREARRFERENKESARTSIT